MNRRHLDADRRRLFPNSGFRHSELGSKIFNAPKAHKYKELNNLRVSARPDGNPQGIALRPPATQGTSGQVGLARQTYGGQGFMRLRLIYPFLLGSGPGRKPARHREPLRRGGRVCVPSYLRLMFVGQPAKFMGMDVGVGHQCLIKRNLPIGHGIHPVCAFREEIQVMGNKNA